MWREFSWVKSPSQVKVDQTISIWICMEMRWASNKAWMCLSKAAIPSSLQSRWRWTYKTQRWVESNRTHNNSTTKVQHCYRVRSKSLRIQAWTRTEVKSVKPLIKSISIMSLSRCRKVSARVVDWSRQVMGFNRAVMRGEGVLTLRGGTSHWRSQEISWEMTCSAIGEEVSSFWRPWEEAWYCHPCGYKTSRITRSTK